MTDPQHIDLSQDVVDLSCERPIFDVQERLYRQRYEQRRWLFWAAIAACVLMLGGFGAFAYSVMCWVWQHPDKTLDWHLLLLGSAMIVPPTLLMWMLMKSVFRADGRLEGNKTEPADGGVWSDLVREALSILRAWVDKKS
ncbi:hypothetical protein [Tepidimonas charontis]|uniref:Transmembrane protein n=1 Tax=Tepidimonas charontis TaxID=2267262 RepID=A0A554XB41_9BURK|nr:hypothetical protein [Tepidimonas charontis]TSE33055.1 hypothetical protein Tchar_01936 [Tepidimonas charontis]